jgi:hypothetical protein
MTCIIIESPFLVELPSRSCFLRRPFLRLRRATLNNWVVISIVYDLPMAKWYQMQWFISINQHFEAEVLSIMAYIYIYLYVQNWFISFHIVTPESVSILTYFDLLVWLLFCQPDNHVTTIWQSYAAHCLFPGFRTRTLMLCWTTWTWVAWPRTLATATRIKGHIGH